MPCRAATKPCLADFVHEPDVFARGQEVIGVNCTDSEVEMLYHAQAWFRRVLVRLEVTIEGNPSSNLVIGDLADIESHPAFRLMPMKPDPDEPTIPVSINVDNPITFASCMADEFAHTYYALLRAGLAASDALAWLDKARTAGWRSRFTLEASTDSAALLEVEQAWRARRVRVSGWPRSLS